MRENPGRAEKIVDMGTAIAIAAIALTLPIALGVVAAALGSQYESSCTTKPGEEPVCTTRYAYKGFGDLDLPLPSLQVIAGAIGVGFGAYVAMKNGKLPPSVKGLFGGEEEPPD